MNTYLILKSLHILGAILFLGNIIVTGWWKVMANKTKNPVIISFAQRQVTLTDFVFTAGGATLLFLAGMANVGVHEMSIMNTPWILWGYILFGISGLLWVVILIPVQMKQAKEAKYFAADTVISDAYWKRETIWIVAGITATVLPLISVVLMVLKPS